jgi:spiro-SPASM protein
MKNLIVINIADGRCLSRTLGGRPAFSWVLDYAAALASPKDTVLAGVNPETPLPVPGGLALKNLNDNADRALINTLAELASGYDNIIYIFGDCPFLDVEISRRMLENHTRYYAHYTFADGYPAGIAPEIIAVRTLSALAALCKDPPAPVARDTLFTLIQRDINAFDLETELSPKDMRLLRASLTVDTRRNHLLCERIAAGIPSAGAGNSRAVLALLEEKPEIMRTLPAFVAVQITEGCPQTCMSCPYSLFGGDILAKKGIMSPEDFDLLAGKVADFCGDAVIGLSLWGEPSFHPAFSRLAGSIAKRPGLSLLVETSGIGWSGDTINETGKILKDRLTWIVSLDAADPELYARLRGKGYAEALDRAAMLLAAFPGRVYVQALRMTENEETMETFYHIWKEKTSQLIIQKYDWFCGFLPQRKVTDLSPLDRFPCRHLQRDLSVLIDGTVPLCREDLHKSVSLGNLLTEDPETIWDRGNRHYRDHLEKNYAGLCGSCDEYYTYNF